MVTARKFALFFIYASFIGWVDSKYSITIDQSNVTLIVILGSGVGIFLAFRINSGYGRWWEARKIWGQLVNHSRSFGVVVSSALTCHSFHNMTIQERQLQKEIIFNYIGFINALRLHLRSQPEEDWDKEVWAREINGRRIFTETESNAARKTRNRPAYIISLINEKLSACLSSQPDREWRYLYFMQLLSNFYDVQGMCERIKNTVFPWGYAYYTHRLVWLFGVLLPFALVHGMDWTAISLSAIIATVFVTVEQVGRNMDRPFENSFNDTPMSALCRTIEIDLLQQINEKNSLKPLEAKHGVLY